MKSPPFFVDFFKKSQLQPLIERRFGNRDDFFARNPPKDGQKVIAQMKTLIENICHKDFAEFTFTGERTYEAFGKLIEIGFTKCQKKNIINILLDVSGANGEWEEFDRFRVGEKISHYYQPPYKIAVIEKKERINKFVEDTAYNRGVSILVTDDRSAALNWLLSE